MIAFLFFLLKCYTVHILLLGLTVASIIQNKLIIDNFKIARSKYSVLIKTILLLMFMIGRKLIDTRGESIVHHR